MLFIYRVIINDCPIAVNIGDVVERAASLITRVKLVSPIGGAPARLRHIRNLLQGR
jgi:hypothetical protein